MRRQNLLMCEFSKQRQIQNYVKVINVDLAVVAVGPFSLAVAVSGAENGSSVAVFEKAAVNMGMGPFARAARCQSVI